MHINLFPRKAPGLRLERRFPGPKPDVLPLDDPGALRAMLYLQIALGGDKA